jgi:hypothetical protein
VCPAAQIRPARNPGAPAGCGRARFRAPRCARACR